MKLTRLAAENVHGYLPIEVDFFGDLTFLTGLNGSGKTSALRLVMALLTPKLEELGAIAFSRAQLWGEDAGQEFTIAAVKTPESLMLQVSGTEHELHMSSSELEVYMQAKLRNEPNSPVIEQYQQHPLVQRIREMATPMFLGLDRRFTAPTPDDEIPRRVYARRFSIDDPSLRGSPTAALLDVNLLVLRKMQQIRAEQEELDEKLRNEFFTKAFVYNPSELFRPSAQLPSRNEVKQYRDQLTQIANAAEGVAIPVPQIQEALTQFFERMTQVVDSLEKAASPVRTGGSQKKASKNKVPMSQAYVEWIINKPQADRILQHLNLLHEYLANRTALRDPIDRFINLINGFLSQSKKSLVVSSGGELNVEVPQSSEPRSVVALSSGERQLVVMLGHLSLNPSLEGSGVFIVDEPELSLHIDWQEKFVDAVQRANPNVQLILATHSPAIILDRVGSTRALTGVH